MGFMFMFIVMSRIGRETKRRRKEMRDLGLRLLTFLRFDSLDRYASSSALLGYSEMIDTAPL